MRTRCFVLLLLTSFAVAQTKTPAAQTPATPETTAPAPEKQGTAPSSGPEIKKAEPAESAVAPEAPVITIDGMCDKPDANPADCKTVITRAQFEQILSMVAPSRAGSPAQLPPTVKRNMATQYSQLLTVANAAEKEGVDKTPQAQELLKFARLQALAQAFTRQLQQKLEPTDAEIQTFYKANADKLQQATLERLFIPKPASDTGKAAASKAKSAGAAAKGVAGTPDFAAKAEKFRQRAVAGESFDKLQKEALAGSNFPNVPETRMVAQKGTLPANQETVFNLKPGEVSQVFNEPSGAYVYKMVSNGAVPLEQVRDEIKQRLTQEKMQVAMDSVIKSSKPVLNDQYFGPAPATQVGPGAARPVPGTPVPAEKPQQGATEKPKPDSEPK